MIGNRIVIFITCLLMAISAHGQRAAWRNNLLYDATLTPNVGAEAELDSTKTVGLTLGLNCWDVNKKKNKKWRHLIVAADMRWWLADSLWHKGYIEADLMYSHFNAGNTRMPLGIYKGTRKRRVQGDMIAVGGKYGYSWVLGSQWHIETEGGLAFGYAWFKEYDCMVCGSKRGSGHRFFILPMLGVNFVYTFSF